MCGVLTLTIACATAIAVSSTSAQPVLSRYRGVTLGDPVQVVVDRLKVTSSDVKVVHERPTLIQRITWRPRRLVSGTVVEPDPLGEMVLTFHLGRLAGITATYDLERTTGLTNADLHEAFTNSYGDRYLYRRQRERRSLPAPSPRQSDAGTMLRRSCCSGASPPQTASSSPSRRSPPTGRCRRRSQMACASRRAKRQRGTSPVERPRMRPFERETKRHAATTRPPSSRNRGVIRVLLLSEKDSHDNIHSSSCPHVAVQRDVRIATRRTGPPSLPGVSDGRRRAHHFAAAGRSLARKHMMPPALGAVEELRWRPQYVRRSVAPSSDPVARLVFSFFENQLFRIVIDYASDRTEGMTEADVVAAVSRIYGAPAKRTHPPSPVGLRPQRPADSVVAQWTDGEHQVALLAVQDYTAFRMIVSSAPLEALARAAGAHETPADVHDWGTLDAARPNADNEGHARETRRANIASFIP